MNEEHISLSLSPNVQVYLNWHHQSCRSTSISWQITSPNVVTGGSSYASLSLPPLLHSFHFSLTDWVTDRQSSSMVLVAVVIVVSSAFTKYEKLKARFEISFLLSSTPLSTLSSLASLWLLRSDSTLLQHFTVDSDITSNAHNNGIMCSTKLQGIKHKL